MAHVLAGRKKRPFKVPTKKAVKSKSNKVVTLGTLLYATMEFHYKV